MIRTWAIAALAVGLAAATPAAADITFSVEGMFDGPGGTLTGTFTTDDAVTMVTGLNLKTTQNGAFEALSYTSVGDIDRQQLPQYSRLTVPFEDVADAYQLQIFFPALLKAAPGVGYAFVGFEHQIEGGNRNLTGNARVVEAGTPSGAPEPAAWALMISGFGMAGGAMRRRREIVSARRPAS